MKQGPDRSRVRDPRLSADSYLDVAASNEDTRSAKIGKQPGSEQKEIVCVDNKAEASGYSTAISLCNRLCLVT